MRTRPATPGGDAGEREDQDVLYSRRKQQAAFREVARVLMSDSQCYRWMAWTIRKRLPGYRLIHVYRALGEMQRRGWVGNGKPGWWYVTPDGREGMAEMLEMIR